MFTRTDRAGLSALISSFDASYNEGEGVKTLNKLVNNIIHQLQVLPVVLFSQDLTMLVRMP